MLNSIAEKICFPKLIFQSVIHKTNQNSEDEIEWPTACCETR